MDRWLEGTQARMGSKAFGWAVALCGIPLGLAVSYGLALLSEPRSLWLWRDMLGLM